MGLDKTAEGYQEEGAIKLLKDIRDGLVGGINNNNRNNGRNYGGNNDDNDDNDDSGGNDDDNDGLFKGLKDDKSKEKLGAEE